MNEQERYQRWLDVVRGLPGMADFGIDLRALYDHCLPSFFRDDLTTLPGADCTDLGASRLEHLPDLPRGMDWPQHNGKAMDFVAQINLAELEAGFHPRLPESGWLYFFVGDFWGERIIPHRVLYFDGHAADLVRTSPPPHLAPPEQVNAYTARLTFRASFSLDPYQHDRILGEVGFPLSRYHEAFEQLDELNPETSRVGGYSYAFQGGGWERDALLALNGYEEQVRQGAFVEEALAACLQPIEMLFGLESALERCWGDAGFLEFFIRQDDLAQRNFSRTFCEIISM